MAAFPYRFNSGKHEGKTVEQVMLRDPAHLIGILGPWSDDKPQLKSLVHQIRRLLDTLSEAPVHAHCSEGRCTRTPYFLTLPLDKYGELHSGAHFWCKKHEPWESRGLSQKLPINLEVLWGVKVKSTQNSIAREIFQAFGIKRGTRITEKFAAKFFADIIRDA